MNRRLSSLDAHQSIVNVLPLSLLVLPFGESLLDLFAVEEIDVCHHRGQRSEGKCVGDGEVRCEEERAGRLEGGLIQREGRSEDGIDVEAGLKRRNKSVLGLLRKMSEDPRLTE